MYMIRSYNLHRSEEKADWETIPSSERNIWQIIASKSSGIITPGNIISLIGAFLVVLGTIRLINGVSIYALTLIALGRIADIADGYVADKTGTKSLLGETFDATIDKILVFIVFIVLLVSQLIPLIVLAMFFLQNLFNSSLSLLAKLKKKVIHPCLEGKLATALCWITVISFLLVDYLDDTNNQFTITVKILSYIAFIAFLYLGFKSSRIYYKQFKDFARTAPDAK